MTNCPLPYVISSTNKTCFITESLNEVTVGKIIALTEYLGSLMQVSFEALQSNSLASISYLRDWFEARSDTEPF